MVLSSVFYCCVTGQPAVGHVPGAPRHHAVHTDQEQGPLPGTVTHSTPMPSLPVTVTPPGALMPSLPGTVTPLALSCHLCQVQ